MVHKDNIIELAKRVAELDSTTVSKSIAEFADNVDNAELFSKLEATLEGVHPDLINIFVSVLGLHILGLIEIKEVK